MYSKVFNIFNGATVQQGVARYLELYKHVLAVNKYYGAASSLSKIAYLSDNNNIRETLLSCLDQFESEKTVVTRTSLLMTYLGQMVCYWFLGEVKAVKMLQSAVKKIEFNVTWWEKNKGNFKEVGGLVVGFALALGGGNAAGGQAVGAHFGKEGYSDRDALSKEINKFETLKKAIITVKFG